MAMKPVRRTGGPGAAQSAIAIAMAAILVAAVFGLELTRATFAFAGFGVLLALVSIRSPKWDELSELSGPGGFKLKWDVQRAQSAAEQAPPEDDSDAEQFDVMAGGELTSLRMKLQSKLAYVSKHLLGTEEHPADVTPGRLNHDGYLTDDEARTADLVLTLNEANFAALPAKQQEAFLEAATALVESIRASVLAGATSIALDDLGWEVERIPGFKRDLLAMRGTRRLRVVPVFVMNRESKLLAKITDRLSGTDGADKRIVVIPSRSRTPTTEAGADPAVVKLDELETALPG
jgi:hypothetical protein